MQRCATLRNTGKHKKQAGHALQTQVPVRVEYAGEIISEDGFRIDLLVDDIVIVELKSVEQLKTVYSKQLLTYLRLAKKPVGLLINFNVPLLKDGIERIAASDLSILGCDPAVSADRSAHFCSVLSVTSV